MDRYDYFAPEIVDEDRHRVRVAKRGLGLMMSLCRGEIATSWPRHERRVFFSLVQALTSAMLRKEESATTTASCLGSIERYLTVST